jgi:GT2 family glycosyltransferase
MAAAGAGLRLLQAVGGGGTPLTGFTALPMAGPDDAVAVLRAAAAGHPGADVLLLHAATQLPDAALPRLLAARQALPAAEVLCTLGAGDPALEPFAPGTDARVDQRDALCLALSEHSALALDHWNPRLALWRGDALARLAGQPWPAAPVLPGASRCLLLDHLYAGPPAAPSGPHTAVAALAARIAAFGAGQALPRPGLDQRPVLLHLLHGWGGGAARFVADLAQADQQRHHLVLVARAEPGAAHVADRLELLLDPALPPVQRWPLPAPVRATALADPDYASVLAQVLARFRVAGLCISSLIGHGLDALRTGLPTAVVCHDQYPLWPALHVDFGDARQRFDAAALGAALEHPALPFAERQPAYWQALREQYVAALAEADALLVAPSTSVQKNLLRLEPRLEARRWVRIEHGLAPWPQAPSSILPPPSRSGLRIVVPGRLHGGKGEDLLAALLEQPLPGIEFVLVGAGRAGMRFFGRRGVHVLMDYERDELPAVLAGLAPDAALLLSTVSETYSYLLSELWSLRLPVLATAVGAFAERISDGHDGLLVPPDAVAIAARLRALAADPAPLRALRQATPPLAPSLATMAAAHRAALPLVATAGVAAPVPASPELLRLLAAEQVLSGLRQELAQAAERHRRDQAELTRRADWGYGLARQLEERTAWAQALVLDVDSARRAHAEVVVAREALQREFDERTAWALSLREELDQVLASASWKLTRPLRVARRTSAALLARLRFQVMRLRALRHRGLRSLRSRGLRGSLARLRQELRAHPLPPAASVPEAKPFAPFALPVSDTPRASIVIPAWNHFDATLLCLRAIAALSEQAPFEVLLVDDCSSDETATLAPQVAGLRYLRNEQNLGFIGACNRGAAAARGEYLVFLNNDTAVQPGWLDALLRTFAEHPRTGMAGARLVYPDGRLQEAGGIVFSDGSGWNYGRFDDPADPRYTYVREVDYCSGAAICLPRGLFERLGGFDSHYAPAYYEDTDLAMRVRAEGLRVLYQPASTVVHFEGVTSGTDTGSGVKAHQVTNQGKFLQRWKDVLARHPAPGTDIAIAREHRCTRRVLVIDATTPAPDHDSGSLRLVNLMRLLREDGAAVTFFADNRAFVPGYSDALQQLGVEVLWHPWLDDPVGWFQRNGKRFDVVFVSRHYVASSYAGLIRLHAPQARFVFDTVDLHYLREQRAAELSGDAEQRRQAAETRARELALVRQADVTLVVSHVEQQLLAREAPGARVEVLSNVHSIQGRRRGFDQRADVVFVGGYQHPPNVDAASWMATTVWPKVRAALPEAKLHLVGSRADERVKALGQLPGVVFHGWVPEIDPFMDECRLAVAPLRYGAGVKGKVNLSMAHGQPVVATTCAIEGMFAEPGREVLVADDAATFAREVVRAYTDKALWTQLSDAGLANVERHFSFDAARSALRRILG